MNDPDEQVVREIEEAANAPGKIEAAKVRAWATRDSVEVLGAVVSHFIRNSRRIEPSLSIEEICGIVQKYYQECLLQNPRDGDYAPNRSVAGHELVSWFRQLWRDSAVPREHLLNLKEMLRELLTNESIPQEHLVDAVLEHLFETPEIADFFADWRTDPQLRGAFDRALQWSRS